MALASLAVLCALLLHGCGAGEYVSTTTQTTTTATTTTSTSTSTTTVTTQTTQTGYGGCIGKDISSFSPTIRGHTNWGSACFCFYTGNCLDFFLPRCWNVSIDITWCQQLWCGQAPFYVGEQYVSFFNHNQDRNQPNPDVLTIPQLWFLNINHLKDQCDDKGEEEVVRQLQQGRVDFAKTVGGVPQWQCYHVQRWVGVEWLHLHSFNDRVHAEELPDSLYPHSPRHALCVSGSSDLKASATWMLANIPANPGMEQEQLGDSDLWTPPGHNEHLVEQIV